MLSAEWQNTKSSHKKTRVQIPHELVKHSLLVTVVDLNGMYDEQVPDDRDDQLGAPVAAAEKKYFIFIILFFYYYSRFPSLLK